MNKQEMISGVQTKVEELVAAVERIEDKAQEIKSAKNKQQKVVDELQAKIEIAKQEIYKSSDLETAKKAKKIVDAFESDLELQKVVNYGSTKAKEDELVQLVEAFFKNHASCKTMYISLDYEMTLQASVRTVVADLEFMGSLSAQINNCFADVKRFMIAQGIVQQGEVLYKGVHLGQMGLSTRLHSIKSALGNEIFNLRGAGIL